MDSWVHKCTAEEQGLVGGAELGITIRAGDGG